MNQTDSAHESKSLVRVKRSRCRLGLAGRRKRRTPEPRPGGSEPRGSRACARRRAGPGKPIFRAIRADGGPARLTRRLPGGPGYSRRPLSAADGLGNEIYILLENFRKYIVLITRLPLEVSFRFAADHRSWRGLWRRITRTDRLGQTDSDTPGQGGGNSQGGPGPRRAAAEPEGGD